METIRVQQNATERIRVTALDEDGAFVTGLTDVLLEIRRKSDGFYFDFDDTTFKSSGWTTRQEQMAELNATNSPGVYYYDFDTTGLSDDEYFTRATSATAENLPAEGELKVGGYVDNIDVAISSRAPAGEYDTELDTTISSRAPASEYDTEMARIDVAVSTRSTLTAAQVWANATRTLSSFGTLVADIWANATRTLTAGTKDTEIDAIKASTDNLPADPASETNVDANETKIDALQTDITIIKTIETGRWKITGTTMILYDTDGTTPLYTFNLKDVNGVAANENVFERDPV